LRGAHRDQEAERAFLHALALRPSFAEAVFQLADLNLQQGRLSEARARIDSYVDAYPANPDLLLLGVRVTRRLGDRVGELRYTQRLRVDFPDSQQTRSLTATSPNPG
jgi:type IV pilus assembly protein PilF